MSHIHDFAAATGVPLALLLCSLGESTTQTFLNWRLAQQFTETAASCRLQTGSPPVAALLNDVRTHEISLNVTLHGQIMIVGLNPECVVAALPDMAPIQDMVNKTLSIVHVIPSAC